MATKFSMMNRSGANLQINLRTKSITLGAGQESELFDETEQTEDVRRKAVCNQIAVTAISYNPEQKVRVRMKSPAKEASEDNKSTEAVRQVESPASDEEEE